MKKRGRKILWYCKGGGIQKMGPYTDQISASEAITLVGGGKPDDAFVWPEYESKTSLPGTTNEDLITGKE